MSKDVRRILLEYAVAVLALGVAVLMRWMLDPILGDNQPFCTLYGGVAIAVWYGGYRPALLATALGYLAVNYLFIDPRGSIEIKGAGAWVSFWMYLLSSSLIIGFAEAMRSARRRLQKEKAKVQQGEAAVQAATQQLQVVTESMAAAVSRCSRNMRYLWVSKPYAEWIGRPAEHVVGRPILEILGDEAFEKLRPHFERVLGNLLGNALRHSPTGGTVHIRFDEEPDWMTISVEDEGAGVSPHVQAQLFQKFQQGAVGRGKVGLGLYFCRIIVAKWGGEIGFTPRDGGGSRFWFKLPALPPPKKKEKAKGKRS